MAESPPPINRRHPGVMQCDDDMQVLLFPNKEDDSSAFMSPSLKASHRNSSSNSSTSAPFPMDESSQTDIFARIQAASAKISVSADTDTKTTSQMTNLTEQTEHPRYKDAWDFEMELMCKSKVFRSVLGQPIPVWNEMEEAVLSYAPQWKPSQRSKLIELWVKFMELKVLVEDYATNEHDLLLEPTQLVGRVWYSIAKNSHLYQEVTFWIQDYHGKARRLIYRPPLTLPQSREEEDTTDSGRSSSGMNSDEAQFAQKRHHKLERAQRLFICYFQQAMPETLKAVNNNMSKRKSNHSTNHQQPERSVPENNIVPENASEDSDFEDNDDSDSDDSYTYEEEDYVDSRTSYTDFSGASADHHWIAQIQSWFSCWKDPFGSNVSTAAATDVQRMDEDRKKKKLLKKKKNTKRIQDDELRSHQDHEFWPCMAMDTTTKQKDDPNMEIRKNMADSVPDLNETTDEGSSTLWVTFDSSKQDITQDDEMTFLTMDTALDQGKSPDNAKLYGSRGRAAPAPQSKRPPQTGAKTKNNLPTTKPKGIVKKNEKDKEKKDWGILPEDWTAIQTKFRIASMIIKEFE